MGKLVVAVKMSMINVPTKRSLQSTLVIRNRSLAGRFYPELGA